MGWKPNGTPGQETLGRSVVMIAVLFETASSAPRSSSSSTFLYPQARHGGIPPWFWVKCTHFAGWFRRQITATMGWFDRVCSRCRNEEHGVQDNHGGATGCEPKGNSDGFALESQLHSTNCQFC